MTAVAARYGFSELGRFSGTYQKLFGERPSETLKSTGNLPGSFLPRSRVLSLEVARVLSLGVDDTLSEQAFSSRTHPKSSEAQESDDRQATWLRHGCDETDHTKVGSQWIQLG